MIPFYYLHPCETPSLLKAIVDDSQELREVKGGAVELRMKLSSLAEVERWVLSWGGNATVVKPIELADSIRQAAKRILGSRR